MAEKRRFPTYFTLHPVEIGPCGANLEAVFSQNRSKMGIWPNLAHIGDFRDSRGGESKTMRVAEIGRATRQNGDRIFGNHKPECLKRFYLRYSGSEKERAAFLANVVLKIKTTSRQFV